MSLQSWSITFEFRCQQQCAHDGEPLLSWPLISPKAQVKTQSAFGNCRFLGLPEGLHLIQ